MSADLPAVLVLGSGPAKYRRYIFEGLARCCRPVLLHREPATWQEPLVVDWAVADLTDRAQTNEVGTRMARRHGCQALVTWEESLVVATTELNEALGLPGLPLDAARACRDKRLQRERFAALGVPSVRFEVVASPEEAAEAAAHIGFPAVIKPSRYGASAGVALVRDEAEARKAAAFVFAMDIPVLGGGPGDVLVEEYVSGTELSIDSWVLGGEIEPFVIARKETGFPPTFEETGHVVGLQWPDHLGIRDTLRAANLALGVERAVSHTEIMLTERGPVVIEVNGRLGGDLIPYVGELITGTATGEVVGRTALGEVPDTAPAPGTLGGVRFMYPPFDMTLTRVRIDPEVAREDWVHTLMPLEEPGTVLRLPPRQHVGRAAVGIVTGPDLPTLLQRMDRLDAAVTVDGAPAPAHGRGPVLEPPGVPPKER